MKFSIITVSFNSVATIETTLSSVAGQTHTDIEHIVIDGGSTDGTLEIIDRYRSGLAHVIAGPDKGIYDAMNKGIAVASGDIIGILNADDFYADRDVITHITSAFEDESVDACYGDLEYVDSFLTGKVLGRWPAAASALQSAGATVETPTSPTPPGSSVLLIIYTSMGGISP